MRQPPRNNQKSSISDETKLSIVLVLMGIGILLLITLVAFLLAGKLPFQAEQSSSIPPENSRLASTAMAPPLTIPTADCGAPTLLIGATTYQIRNIDLAPDGSASLPPQENGVAYRVQDTGSQNVFILSPTPENLTLLTSLSAGTSARATWSNCNSMTFTLSEPLPGDFGTPSLSDPSTASIAIYLPLDPTGEGFVVTGELAEEVVSVLDTPAPDESGVLAEIGLMDMSSDGSTITLTVSVYNFGGETFTLSAENVALTLPDGAPVDMSRSDPRLPERVDPGQTKNFTFTFPRPSTPNAVLRVFTVEYEVEGY